jgi:ketosteroid isomerase-like protein
MGQETERDQLLEVLRASSTRFQHGDPSGMLEFYADRDDVTLFGALGGCALGRDEVTKISQRASAALGRGGEAQYEVLAMQVEGNLAYVVGVERLSKAAEGVGALRVTNILRRVDGVWRLMHRHADALRDSPFA